MMFLNNWIAAIYQTFQCILINLFLYTKQIEKSTEYTLPNKCTKYNGTTYCMSLDLFIMPYVSKEAQWIQSISKDFWDEAMRWTNQINNLHKHFPIALPKQA